MKKYFTVSTDPETIAGVLNKALKDYSAVKVEDVTLLGTTAYVTYSAHEEDEFVWVLWNTSGSIERCTKEDAASWPKPLFSSKDRSEVERYYLRQGWLDSAVTKSLPNS